MYYLWINQHPYSHACQKPLLIKVRAVITLICLICIILFSSTRPAGAQIPREPLVAVRTAAITPDPTVQFMINQVESGALYTYVAELSGEVPATIGGETFTLETRSTNATSSIQKATQYAYEHFQKMGLAVSFRNWTLAGKAGRNVIAEQPGSNPNCIYLLIAHIDNTSNSPLVNAPGADDNASGTAGVLAAANILSQYNFTCTLRYALFTGEEQGLLGSTVYASQAAANSDPILGVLNLDMIGYNTPNTTTTIEMDVRSGTQGAADRVLSNMVEDVIDAYGINLTPRIFVSTADDSDHASFWNAGYPAVLMIEDWDDHTPDYHKQTDLLSTLNMPYFTDFARVAVGAIAHLSQVVTVPPETLPNHLYLSFTQN